MNKSRNQYCIHPLRDHIPVVKVNPDLSLYYNFIIYNNLIHSSDISYYDYFERYDDEIYHHGKVVINRLKEEVDVIERKSEASTANRGYIS